MRTEASWEEQQRALKAAKVLADFANLEPDGAEDFREAHPDFVPQAWWDYRPTTPFGLPSPTMQWQINQKFLRDAWLFEFNMELGPFVHLLTSVFDPSKPEPPLFERPHRPAFVAGLDIGYETEDELPYYLAVKWLGGQGWRAKTCLFCGKRFIAEHPKSKFCSFGVTVDEKFNVSMGGTINDIETTCFWAHRKKEKAKNWSENSDRINKRRKQEYRRSRRAKRKQDKLKAAKKKISRR